MTSVIDLYERLRTAPDDETRARIIAEAFEQLEDRYPELRDLATASAVRESELHLRKEIEQTRLEIAQVRADLSKEIEQVRADLSKEIEQVRADLSKEIEQTRSDLRVEIERLRGETASGIEKARFSLLRWMLGLFSAQMFALILLILRGWGTG